MPLVDVEAFRYDNSADLPGSPEKPSRKAQRCSGCGRWFTPKGYDAHIDTCVLRDNPYIVFKEDKGVLEKHYCSECGGFLRQDLGVGEQDYNHKYPCPHHSESPF
jgi:hypothetical protein